MLWAGFGVGAPREPGRSCIGIGLLGPRPGGKGPARRGPGKLVPGLGMSGPREGLGEMGPLLGGIGDMKGTPRRLELGGPGEGPGLVGGLGPGPPRRLALGGPRKGPGLGGLGNMNGRLGLGLGRP